MGPGLEKAPTGIPGLDQITGGGLPRGRVTLVAGSAGAGKTLLGLEFLVAGARQYGEPGVLVTLRGVGGQGHRQRALARLRPRPAPAGRPARGALVPGRARRDHRHRRVRPRAALPDPGRRDRADRARSGSCWTRSRCCSARSATTRPCGPNSTGWPAGWRSGASPPSSPGNGATGPHPARDRGVRLRLRDRARSPGAEEISTRRLRVVKYRGSAHGTNEFPFLISARGFVVLPITSVALDYGASEERISTGVDRLDHMLGGGVFRGSTILVSGTAGTGKTSLGAHLVNAACRAASGRCGSCSRSRPPRSCVTCGRSASTCSRGSTRACCGSGRRGRPRSGWRPIWPCWPS